MNDYAAGYFDLIYKKLSHMDATDREAWSSGQSRRGT